MLSLMRAGDDPNGVRFRPSLLLACARENESDPQSPVEDWATIIAPTTGDLATTKGLSGVQVRWTWNELEAVEGVYTFDDIVDKLNDLKQSSEDGGHKLLSILIQTKTFRDTHHVAPLWLRNATYGGGEHLWADSDGATAEGYILAFQNTALKEKFSLLAAALGKRFAHESQIELIGFTEMMVPGIGLGGTGTGAEATAGHFAGALTCLLYIKAAFPRTIVRQITNYSKPEVAAIMPDYISNGIGIGGPDTFMNETQLWETGSGLGIYDHIQNYAGQVPVIFEVQARNYDYINLARRLEPANGWAATAVPSDAGGGNTLIASATIDHGLSTSDTTDYLNIYGSLDANLKINTTANGWTAGSYNIVSVPTSKGIIVSRTFAGAESFPTTMAQASSPAWPLSGQSYVPNANTYVGFAPSITQIMDYIYTEFPLTNYVILTRSKAVSALDPTVVNYKRALSYINAASAKYGKSARCSKTRPASIA